MRKAWTVSNAFYGVLKLFADIISMSLVLASSVVNFALTLGIDTIKFASGWLLKPLSAVLNYYIGKEQEQVKEEQVKEDENKAIESAEAIAKANIETWLVERSEIKNLRAEVKEEVPAEVEVKVEEEPTPEVEEPTLEEKIIAKQAEIDAMKTKLGKLYTEESGLVEDDAEASDEDKGNIEAFNKLTDEMKELDDALKAEKAVEAERAEQKAELDELTAEIVKAPEAKEGEEAEEVDPNAEVEFMDGVNPEKIARYEELKAKLEPKVEEVAEESKAEEPEAEDADKADEKDATKEKEVVKTTTEILLKEKDSNLSKYLTSDTYSFFRKPVDETTEANTETPVPTA